MRIMYVILVVNFLISSCATGPILTGGHEEELLRDRVKLFWEAKEKRDWEAVKDFVEPDIRKDVFPYLDSLKTRPPMAKLISYDIKEITFDAKKAKVLAKVTWKVEHPFLESPVMHESEIRDVWVNKGGIWYVIIERPNLSDILKTFGQKRKGGEN